VDDNWNTSVLNAGFLRSGKKKMLFRSAMHSLVRFLSNRLKYQQNYSGYFTFGTSQLQSYSSKD